VTTDERAELLSRYREGVAEVERALEGADAAELDAAPADGGWSPRKVVHHLADSETNSYIRVRKLLAEDATQIQGYDEAMYADRLHYERPIDASLAVFRAVRASTAELLERLGPGDWERAGTHSESGAYSMDDWLRIYASHGHDHADQIRRARAGG
jgi:DinB superfamily